MDAMRYAIIGDSPARRVQPRSEANDPFNFSARKKKIRKTNYQFV
jgi:hypothetical protein